MLLKQFKLYMKIKPAGTGMEWKRNFDVDDAKNRMEDFKNGTE